MPSFGSSLKLLGKLKGHIPKHLHPHLDHFFNKHGHILKRLEHHASHAGKVAMLSKTIQNMLPMYNPNREQTHIAHPLSTPVFYPPVQSNPAANYPPANYPSVSPHSSAPASGVPAVAPQQVNSVLPSPPHVSDEEHNSQSGHFTDEQVTHLISSGFLGKELTMKKETVGSFLLRGVAIFVMCALVWVILSSTTSLKLVAKLLIVLLLYQILFHFLLVSGKKKVGPS